MALTLGFGCSKNFPTNLSSLPTGEKKNKRRVIGGAVCQTAYPDCLLLAFCFFRTKFCNKGSGDLAERIPRWQFILFAIPNGQHVYEAELADVIPVVKTSVAGRTIINQLCAGGTRMDFCYCTLLPTKIRVSANYSYFRRAAALEKEFARPSSHAADRRETMWPLHTRTLTRTRMDSAVSLLSSADTPIWQELLDPGALLVGVGLQVLQQLHHGLLITSVCHHHREALGCRQVAAALESPHSHSLFQHRG
ncbi:hypothetical protein MLD38_004763 [Melastoma candidum]|uniref:Uncharacterized protein n=1 Tax=Melastoma candidum TaxID=119954 RepID=A0ACB9S8M0_9MYRT|nr:hypothetical protein MLD38_004763 [Melastoma candidum]